MKEYYSKLLNANNLKQCYEIAPPRVKQFLNAEISFIANKCNKNDLLLDLGCGYGRVAVELIDKVKKIIGIDYSRANIELADGLLGKNDKCDFFEMNAIDLHFEDNTFDKVICVQNGISAFKLDPVKIIQESVRVTKKGGILLYSSYSEKFWNHRLEWFKLQSEQGLLGEIDYQKTGNGVIICKDGFEAKTFSKEDFLKITSEINVNAKVSEIDDSCIICEMIVQ